jgi:hypothetical protein
LDLLEEIKSLKKELEALPPWDPKTGKWGPEFYEIQRKNDGLSVQALRFSVRSLPPESRRPGFRLVFDSHGEYAKVLPGFGDFHPDLPPWAPPGQPGPPVIEVQEKKPLPPQSKPLQITK